MGASRIFSPPRRLMSRPVAPSLDDGIMSLRCIVGGKERLHEGVRLPGAQMRPMCTILICGIYRPALRGQERLSIFIPMLLHRTATPVVLALFHLDKICSRFLFRNTLQRSCLLFLIQSSSIVPTAPSHRLVLAFCAPKSHLSA